jgi:hypothetical protein
MRIAGGVIPADLGGPPLAAKICWDGTAFEGDPPRALL